MLFKNNPLKKYQNKLTEIDSVYKSLVNLDELMLRRNTKALMDRYNNGESLESLLPTAFAMCKEAVRRVLGKEYYDTQLIAGMILNDGKIAEMKTGEGKTLVSILPSYLNALSGKNIHITTVNSYLANRDKEQLEPVFNLLGLTVGLSIENMSTEQKKEAYKCNITFAVNTELGFDLLRDNIVLDRRNKVLNGMNYIIIDEADSILIDEAVVPLIISGSSKVEGEQYGYTNSFVQTLIGEDYELENGKIIYLTDKGMEKAELYFNVDLSDGVKNAFLMHCISNSLRTNYILKRNTDYVVQDNEIIIVDQNTGRLAIGRKYSSGLHQAIEAKENVPINMDNKMIASITYQNFFNMYEKVCGMTGTGKTDEKEFKKIYGLEVYEVPTNKQIKRVDEKDLLFETSSEKYDTIVQDICNCHDIERPVLVGCSDIYEAEIISRMLITQNIQHTLLTAKNKEEEALIISLAGQRKAITISTNMAGRGTDITLEQGVNEIGGLRVIGTCKCDNKRIENQLRGRAGRQGDNGSSQFYISLDEQMISMSENFEKYFSKIDIRTKAGMKKALVKIGGFQKSLSDAYFSARDKMYEEDQILHLQRLVIYKQRDEILENNDMNYCLELAATTFKDIYQQFLIKSFTRKTEKKQIEIIIKFFNDNIFINDKIENSFNSEMELRTFISKRIQNNISLKIVQRKEEIDSLSKNILLKTIDENWINHIENVDDLKFTYIYKQDKKNTEWIIEVNKLFETMHDNIQIETLRKIYNL